jgi:hypothetical protein
VELPHRLRYMEHYVWLCLVAEVGVDAMSQEAMKLAWEAEKKVNPHTAYNSWCRGYEAAPANHCEDNLNMVKQEQGEQDNYQGSDAAKAAHMMDLYTALGVRWGDDPFAVIAKMRDQQPKQEQGEPVAIHQFRHFYCADWYDGVPDQHDGFGPYEVRTLYTTPQPKREWIGLTEKEQDEVFKTFSRSDAYKRDFLNRVARAIETKLKEKNT